MSTAEELCPVCRGNPPEPEWRGSCPCCRGKGYVRPVEVEPTPEDMELAERIVARARDRRAAA